MLIYIYISYEEYKYISFFQSIILISSSAQLLKIILSWTFGGSREGILASRPLVLISAQTACFLINCKCISGGITLSYKNENEWYETSSNARL